MDVSNATCSPVFELCRSNGDLTTNAFVISLFVVAYSLIFVAGIIGNLFVIVAVARNKQLQSVRNMFIVNLSCSDLTVCFSSLTVTPTAALIKLWPFGSALCKIIPWFQGTNLLISTFTLSCIAIDRYILILHPTSRPITKNKAIGLIMFIWLLALLSAFPVFQFNAYEENMQFTVGNLTYCDPTCGERWPYKWLQEVYGGVLLFIQFILPLALIAFCYSRILYSLAHGVSSQMNARRRRNNELMPQTEREQEAMRKRRRTNRMLISMVVLFACCWFPNILIRCLLDFGVLNLSPAYSFLVPLVVHCVAMTSVFWNPVLYGWFNEQFRLAFLQYMHVCIKQTRNQRTGHAMLDEMPSTADRSNRNGQVKLLQNDQDECQL